MDVAEHFRRISVRVGLALNAKALELSGSNLNFLNPGNPEASDKGESRLSLIDALGPVVPLFAEVKGEPEAECMRFESSVLCTVALRHFYDREVLSEEEEYGAGFPPGEV